MGKYTKAGRHFSKNILSAGIVLALFWQVSFAITLTPSTKPDAAAKTHLVESYGKLPLSFEANQGQTDKQVKFISRGQGYGLFLTPTEAVLSLHKTNPIKPKAMKQSPTAKPSVKAELGKPTESATLRMKLVNSNPNPKMQGLDELPGKVNYLRGKDQNQWQTKIPTYAKAKYEKVYPGIDLVYYGNQRQLEYDFIVEPGADPKAIRLDFEGADKLAIDKQGNLVVKAQGGDVILNKPVAYQTIKSKRQEVDAKFTLLENRTSLKKGKKSNNKNQKVSFQLAAYDKSQALVIDPVLQYSTYLGYFFSEESNGIVVDSAGNAYVTGTTNLFPEGNLERDLEVFVAKFNTSGTQLLYSSFLGGASSDFSRGIAVDNAGNAYVTGMTISSDFPTLNASYPNYAGGSSDAFVTKLDASGSLLYSTFLGGDFPDEAMGIAVDSAENAYVTGNTDSADFPTANASYPIKRQGTDVFVTKLDSSGFVLYSTFLGGDNTDRGFGIAVDSAENAYVTGHTLSTNFRAVNALYPFIKAVGYHDAFVTKLDTNSSQVMYSTYLGGADGDTGLEIAVDSAGNAYVTGSTSSSNFPMANPSYPNAGQLPNNSGWTDAFVTKLNASGSQLLYSTYLGGIFADHGRGIAVDNAGNAYVTGETSSSNFPMVNAIYPTYSGLVDAFVVKFNASGSVVYSTYLGGTNGDYGNGIAVDSAGNAYVTGQTNSPNFPTHNTNPDIVSYQPEIDSGRDAFVSKISNTNTPPPPPVLSVSPATPLNFGSVPINTPKELPLTITNTGNGTLTGSASTSLPYSINTPANFSLAAGQSQVLTVRFNPTSTAASQGTIAVFSNGGNRSVSASGAGVITTTTVPPQNTVNGAASTEDKNNLTGSYAEPVNTNTGNYYYQHTDLSLPGRGLPLNFTRTLNVLDASVGPFGPGWTHSYHLVLTEQGDGSVTIKMGDGHEEYYDPSTTAGQFTSRYPGIYSRLVKNTDNSYTLIQKNLSRIDFNTAGRMTKMADRNGNALTFAYNSGNDLASITDTVGRVIALSYDANHHLTSLTDPTGRAVRYAYDANGNLISDTDANGGIMRYQYTASGLLASITDRRGNVLIANTYDTSKRVVSQLNGKGGVTTFVYDTPNPGDTQLTDPLGHVTIHTHDNKRRIIAETDPLGHKTQYVYDANNNRTKVIDKNGQHHGLYLRFARQCVDQNRCPRPGYHPGIQRPERPNPYRGCPGTSYAVYL